MPDTDEEVPDPDKIQSFSKITDDPRDEMSILRNLVTVYPIEAEPKIETLDAPLIIENACPGWQPRQWPPLDAYPEHYLPPNHEEGGVRYPAVPCDYEDQAQELIDAVEAGCAATHIHPRDPSDCFASHDRKFLKPVYDRIFDEVTPVTFQDCWTRTPDGVDLIEDAKANMEIAGGSNKYVQGALINWPPGESYDDTNYREHAQEGIEFYKENGIKPLNKLRGAYHQRKLHRDIIQPGVLEPTEDDPLVVIHDMGHPKGWPMDQDPWMPLDMITAIEETRDRFPEHTKIGVYSGGRNWLPITFTSIMLGVDMIRIGIEDAYWMYPHKNEVIQRNMDIVNKVMTFCDLIGREVATPDQTREMLGIEIT